MTGRGKLDHVELSAGMIRFLLALFVFELMSIVVLEWKYGVVLLTENTINTYRSGGVPAPGTGTPGSPVVYQDLRTGRTFTSYVSDPKHAPPSAPGLFGHPVVDLVVGWLFSISSCALLCGLIVGLIKMLQGVDTRRTLIHSALTIRGDIEVLNGSAGNLLVGNFILFCLLMVVTLRPILG